MRGLLIAFILLLTLAVVGVAVFLVLTQGPLHAPVTETALGPFDYADPEHVFFTHDAERVARVESDAGRECVALDGKPGPLFTRIGSVVFSRDGQHVAYVANQDGRFLVVTDGEPGSVYDDILRPPLYSPDGGRMVYAARLARREFIVLDGRPGQEHDSVVCSDDAFSTTGEHLLYVATDVPREYLVVDGRPCSQHTGIAWAFFGPDDEPVYVAIDKGKSRLVIGSSVGPPFDEITVPSFSPDGSRVTYRAKRDGRRLVVVDGKEGPAYDDVTRPVFSPDGQRVVYVAEQGTEAFTVDNGDTGIGYFRIRDVVFRPNQQLAFVAGIEGRDMLVVDGLAGPQFDRIELVRFGPKDRRVAYVVQEDKHERMVIDGEPQFVCDSVSAARFSPDGSHVAYAARRGSSQQVVVDRSLGPPYDSVLWGPLRINRDGRRAVYTDAAGKRWLLLFGAPIDAAYRGQTLDVPRFADDGSFEYLARRRTSLVLVRQQISNRRE